MKEIPYIESTGTQYIDTGVYGSNTIDVEISISPSVSFSGWAWLLGGMQSNVQRSYTLAIYSLNTTTIQRGTDVFHDDSYSFVIGQRYKLKLSGTQFTINDSAICNLSNQSFTTPVTMYLFANDNQDAGGVASAYIPIRLYYCKIWDNGTLIRDFVPAVENGHAGLYDRVNEQFYGNSGTGEFETPIWYVDSEGNLTNDYMPDVLPQMEQPFPYALWRVENGILQNKLAPNGELVGAFANAISLQKVHIPKSCKKIGMYAFRNTQLMSVTIASDCEYYNTSFPDGCTINFYPD